jgi:hypothetical protein
MKIAYIAEDGTQFSSEDECLVHESGTTLDGHVLAFCGKTYKHNFGCSVIEVDDVASYIFTHIDKINELVKITNAR